MDILQILVPMFLYNQSYIEYTGTAQVNVMQPTCGTSFNNPSFEAPMFIAYLPEFKDLVGQIGDPLEDAPYNALFEAYRDLATQKLNYNTHGS